MSNLRLALRIWVFLGNFEAPNKLVDTKQYVGSNYIALDWITGVRQHNQKVGFNRFKSSYFVEVRLHLTHCFLAVFGGFEAI